MSTFLDSLVFINTRPSDRSARLSHTLITQGVNVLDMPFLELLILELSSQEKAALSQINQFAQVVVTSPTAALQGVKYISADLPRLKHIRWIAVGKATQNALQMAGITALSPRVENSEGLLTLIDPHVRTQLWAGVGGRLIIQEALQRYRHDFMRLCFYERRVPAQLNENWKKLQTTFGNKHLIILISSENSWQTWQPLANLQNNMVTPLVLGGRVMQLVLAHYPKAVQIASLQPKDIIQQLWTLKHE